MSQENVEIVRRAGEAWQRGGIDAMLEFLDPGVEWRVRPDLPESGTYRGHEGVRRLFTRFEEVLEGQGYEPQEYIDAGDLVVMPLHWWGRGRRSGAVVAERQGETWVFTVRDGRVATVHEYRDKREAIEAAGLEE
jgi:uncharacterized protein